MYKKRDARAKLLFFPTKAIACDAAVAIAVVAS